MCEPSVPSVPSVPITFEEALRLIYAERLKIMQDRQRKYGPDNIRATGLLGIAVRLRDKWERFWRFAADTDDTVYADESVTDTLIDMGNYSDIALILKRGWWGLPMEEEEEGEEEDVIKGPDAPVIPHIPVIPPGPIVHKTSPPIHGGFEVED